MISAKIIADSKYKNTRLISFEIELHRFILPEKNTHRCFSRNYQSSRAVPVLKLLKQISSDPAMPVYWGSEQSGMVAGDELTGIRLLAAKLIWRASAKIMAFMARQMQRIGVHKQITNRILEPFMWTRGVVTATEEGFNSFFKLRIHPDAQPEIKALAEVMAKEIFYSEPKILKAGQWHMPYISSLVGTLDNIKISTSCVAQASYRVLDRSIEKAIKIYEMLKLPSNGIFKKDPPHFSPAEHCSMAIDKTTLSPSECGGNFQTTDFFQYRKMLEQGVESSYVMK